MTSRGIFIMRDMQLVYIAGSFRAVTPWEIEQNVRKAECCALEVAKLGFVPLCPHSMYRFFQDSLPDSFWLEATLALLKPCDAIFLIPGWEASSGAAEEKAYAEENEIAVCLSLSDVKLLGK